jgi:hypothetical protein
MRCPTPRYSQSGVRLDVLFNLRSDEVIDVTSPLFRGEGGYRWWRAVSLGKIALNLMAGRYEVNTRTGGGCYWSESHAEARATADTMRTGSCYTGSQFRTADQTAIAEVAGVALDPLDTLVLPTMVVAMRDTRDLPPGPDGFPGYRCPDSVPLSGLDHESVLRLHDIFEVPILFR